MRFPTMKRLARALAGDLRRRWIEAYCGWPIIRNCTACDRAHIAASTFECFLITFLTSPEDKFCGSALTLMAAGNLSTGFLDATKPPNFSRCRRDTVPHRVNLRQFGYPENAQYLSHSNPHDRRRSSHLRAVDSQAEDAIKCAAGVARVCARITSATARSL